MVQAVSWRPGSERGWRRLAIPHILALCQRTWHASYDHYVEDMSSFMVARIEAAMTGEGRYPWKDCKLDCSISFERVPLAGISVTNPQRVEMSVKGYPQLKEMLERDPARDSVPIICCRIGGRVIVWDGHHRLRTYDLAGRPDIPALVAHLTGGDGVVKIA